MNSFAILQALIFEPKKAFAAIAERPRFLLPLLLGVVTVVVLAVWYVRTVDVEWLIDQQIRAGGAGRQLTEVQITDMAKSAAAHPGRIAAIGAVGNALFVPILFLVISLYNLLAGKITNVQRSFGQWFAFTCWVWLPAFLLSSLVAAIVLATASNTQIGEGELRVLSLNALVFHKTAGESGYALLNYVGVPELFTLWLGILGVREWSRRTWVFAGVFTLLPVALIAGGVALIAMGRS